MKNSVGIEKGDPVCAPGWAGKLLQSSIGVRGGPFKGLQVRESVVEGDNNSSCGLLTVGRCIPSVCEAGAGEFAMDSSGCSVRPRAVLAAAILAGGAFGGPGLRCRDKSRLAEPGHAGGSLRSSGWIVGARSADSSTADGCGGE